MSIQYKTVKGTQDFEPSRQALREFLVSSFTEKAKVVGCVPISTPIIEREDVLMEKYGPDSDKEIFTLTSEGEDTEKTALRYDQTVPFSRYVKSKDIKKIKRYTVGSVFRRDQPNMGDGRYREFLQCDFDWLGDGDLPLMDAEALCLLIKTLRSFNLPTGFTVKINTRQILYAILKFAGVPEDKYVDVSRTIDKLDKKSWKQLVPDLIQGGITTDVIENLGKIVKKLKGDNWDDLPFVNSEYLNNILKYMGLLYDKKLELLDIIRIDPTLARGLDYYTGIIFEVVLEGNRYKKIGSVAGGGRYDNLCDIPCVGFSIGIDRLLTVYPNSNKIDYNPEVWIIQVNEGLSPEVISELYLYRLKILNRLRCYGIRTDTEPRENAGFGPQLKYVLKKKIPYTIFIGTDEMKNKKVTIKDMLNRKRYDKISLDEAAWIISPYFLVGNNSITKYFSQSEGFVL